MGPEENVAQEASRLKMPLLLRAQYSYFYGCSGQEGGLFMMLMS